MRAPRKKRASRNGLCFAEEKKTSGVTHTRFEVPEAKPYGKESLPRYFVR